MLADRRHHLRIHDGSEQPSADQQQQQHECCRLVDSGPIRLGSVERHLPSACSAQSSATRAAFVLACWYTMAASSVTLAGVFRKMFTPAL